MDLIVPFLVPSYDGEVNMGYHKVRIQVGVHATS